MDDQSKIKSDNNIGDLVTDGITQYVDLARFLPKRQKVYLSLDEILQICAGALIVVMLFLSYGYWERILLNRHIAQLQLQRDALVGQISSDRLKKIQELTGSEAIYAILKTQYAANAPGFSAYLAAISQACPAGVWLTAINIKKNNHITTLTGKGYRSYDIMQMVDNLNRSPLFTKYPFFLLKIDQVKEKAGTKEPQKNRESKAGYYTFTLQTQQAQTVMEQKT